MNLAELNAVLRENSDGVLRQFKLDGEMAGVVIHPKVLREPWIVSMFRPHAVEEMNRFAAGFQQARRLRFQSQVQFAAGLPADTPDMFDAVPQLIANHLPLFRSRNVLLGTAGHGADAPFDAARQNLRQQIKQQIRVLQPRLRSPIRQINLLLDACAMELAERKSVDRENVAMVLAQPALELEHRGAGVQFPR